MSERKASMGDMVYRGDVIKYIRNNISLDTFMKRTVSKADEACWELCDKLNFVPAIDPVKHGRWINNGNGTYSCNLCKSWIPQEQHYYANFCLYCGAKMDEVER